MSLVEHARAELDRCGITAEDPAYAASIIRAVEAFASYPHSGTSASLAREQLHRLLAFEPLTALTDEAAEWMQIDTQLWQSRRDPEAFSVDGGLTYWLTSERPTGGPLHRSTPAGNPDQLPLTPDVED